jgi:hypothetical protein
MKRSRGRSGRLDPDINAFGYKFPEAESLYRSDATEIAPL